MGTLLCLNVGFGDASIIKSQGATFLIDCHEINEYIRYLPPTKIIHGVFITHQHHDHYSGLQFLKDNDYSIKYLIFSPYDRRRGDNSVTYEEWNEFNSLKNYFTKEGAKPYPSYRQNSFDKPWWNTHGVQFYIIGPDSSVANSDTREIHDACLVITAILNKRQCLFTGDASDANLEYIANNTIYYCNDILHASHHGSLNGANLKFIKKCNAKHTLISTKSGSYENIPHPTALTRYRYNTKHHVRRTDVDGSWEWKF